MGSLRKYISYILRGLLLFLFLGYYGSITMFYHSHIVNGHVLNHSHPYKPDKNNDSPYESHTHSSSAYNFIEQLNEAVWKDTSAIADRVPDPIIYYYESRWPVTSFILNSANYSLTLLRAPPATC